MVHVPIETVRLIHFPSPPKNCPIFLSYICLFLFTQSVVDLGCGMWDLSSWVPLRWKLSLNHWTPEKSQNCSIFNMKKKQWKFKLDI